MANDIATFLSTNEKHKRNKILLKRFLRARFTNKENNLMFLVFRTLY
jgi:hypothetical protein